MRTHKAARAVTAVVTAVLLSTLAACGGDAEPEGTEPTSSAPTSESPGQTPTETATESPSESESETSEAADEAMIVIEDFKFSDPGPVAPGATITVVNKDGATHTVTAEDEGGFDANVPGDETVTFTAPEQAGEYPFLCTLHPAMTGTLVVE